jgi:hypothetical protein
LRAESRSDEECGDKQARHGYLEFGEYAGDVCVRRVAEGSRWEVSNFVNDLRYFQGEAL